MKVVRALGVSDALPAVAEFMYSCPVEKVDSDDVFVSHTPIVVEFEKSMAVCPGLVCMGNPFENLLSGLAFMFPTTTGCRFPDTLEPNFRLDVQTSPKVIGSQVVRDTGSTIVVGNCVVVLDLCPDGESSSVGLNVLYPVGAPLHAIANGMVRWSFFHQAVSAFAGATVGYRRMQMLVSHQSVADCEAVLKEVESLADTDSHLSHDRDLLLGVMGGGADDWLREASMFCDEHVMALGYQDRSLRSLFVPAAAAWNMYLLSEGDESAMADIAAQLRCVRDHAWRRLLTRYVQTVLYAPSE